MVDMRRRHRSSGFGVRVQAMPPVESPTMTLKTDTLTAIMNLNPTATPEFLSEFTNEQLTGYLDRLRRVVGSDPDVASSGPRAAGATRHEDVTERRDPR